MREGSGKKTAVACVLNLLVTSTTAACIPALHMQFVKDFPTNAGCKDDRAMQV